MRKFFILLKKEVRELLTLQVILPLIITTVMFGVIGQIIGNEAAKAQQPIDVAVLNEDNNSQTSQMLITIFKASHMNVKEIQGNDLSGALATVRNEKKAGLLVIPQGFEQSIIDLQPKPIGTYTVLRNLAITSNISSSVLTASLGVANSVFSDSLITQYADGVTPDALKNPIKPNEYVVVGDKQANVGPAVIMGFVMQQTMFIPIILFIVIIFAAQMIATAIANEKENKTLETLLTTPASRTAIVVAKMAAAGIIALLSSGVYMIGFRYYINGLSGGQEMTSQVGEAVKQLGLTLAPESYVLLGLSLFVGILVALSISLILGAFAEDVKSVAGLTSPIMVLVMIPYFLTMFIDINTLPITARYGVYAIPFAHIFLAAPSLFLHNPMPVIYGILYQFAWFVLFVAIAVKIFSTDKIVTMKLNFSKKKKLF